MPLATEDIEQVKNIVLETFQEHFSQSSPSAGQATPTNCCLQEGLTEKWPLQELIWPETLF